MKSRRRDDIVQFCRENTLLVMTMFSVFLGVVLGFGLRPLNLSQETLQLINFPGEIFMQVLKMMILPLIFSSLISALAQMDAKESGQMGASTVLYYLATAILATLRMALISGRQMGPDMPTLAKQFKTSKSVIWATLNTPNRSKATGRPLKTSSGDDRIIVRMSKKNPRLTNTDINSELKDQYGVQDSVQGHCQKTSAQRWILRKWPSEQANDSGEEPFSSTEVGKGSSALEWNKVLWSDESKYLMIGTEGIIHVRRPVDKRYDPKYQVPTVKHCGGNVMVWGCFHANGVGPLIRITEIMNRYMYKDILEKEMLPYGRFQMGRGWLFQQDNDPKHTSHFVKDWFAQRRVNVLT
uniref:Amino acid transporter n=1 Tax=Caenorhabditis japonica TaxID=281687 RepID=A0A8R1EUQ5_CAEJA